ncbi:hypothetical protein [Corynebacterium sp. HMSC28B08]|uniref:hypothetical protein n=1 Tax=Corynebacterium sp. HMSC28B08 TaxID=1581066 RepID=UPI0008A1A7E8|nr:hypothetical protein [Corynebacterium sp. HMSC28B08]OFT91393.1 hypothetical protein HMPREF3098_01145 [Corynebacterium sp. HMSC28B08]
MPNISDAKQIMWGSNPVREVRYGNTLVWPKKLLWWTRDFETPGTHTITVPDGATHFYFWLSAGGNSGQRGDGALANAGLGGRGGKVHAGYGGSITASTGTVKIGKGGVEPEYSGAASTLTLGLAQYTAEPNSQLFSADSGGMAEGYGSTNPTNRLLKNVPGMIGDGKIFTTDNGGIYNGPPGKYVNNTGTPGVRGGGGSGGAGGIFGSYRAGGPGGDGFCRIIFTNQQIQTP